MKVFAALFIIVAAAVASVAAAGGYGASSGGYGGASIPAPPCPKNYLFSCQPSLTPAPCSQPAPSYGSAGAYSEYVPNYVNAPLGVSGQGYSGYYGVQGLTGGYQGGQGQHGYQVGAGAQY